MATTTSVPTKLGAVLTNKEVNFTSDTFIALLTTVGYSYNQDTHKYLSDVTNECSGTGYARQTLTSVTGPTFDATTHQTRFGCANITFPTASVSNARKCIIVDDTPSTDATRPIIVVIDFGVDKDLSSGGLSIVINAAGFFATQGV